MVKVLPIIKIMLGNVTIKTLIKSAKKREIKKRKKIILRKIISLK